MANSNYEDKLLDAIEAVVNNAVKKAGYDRTIQCQIVECLDATIGKYKVKYQDSTFIAYSGNTDIPFMNGADVYVLVPGNDMTREKQILGTTKKLGTSLAGVVFDQDAYYEQVGGNCIDESGSYSFSSYKDEIKVIYDKTEGINDLHLNLQSIETYIRRSSSLLCGGMFQTQLPIEQQYRGNFGVVFELSFLDKASDNSILRNYVVDVNQMLGNPYKQTKWTRQYAIFDFDVSDFQYINRIYLFVDNFPHKADDKPTDIFIKDLELFGVELASEAELNSYGLSILTPDGTYFELADAPTAVKNLQAQLKLKGKNIDNTNTDIQYYWFVENVSITLSNPLYCVYGGQGWECKNSKNKVGTDSNGEPVYEWVPAKSLYTVLKQDVPARETRFKCVAVYNDVIISKEVVITNYASEWDITVESDSGDRFYHGIGAPTLVCKINDTIKTDDNFTYMWAVTDCNNIFLSLSETTDANKEYNDAVAGYNNLLASIEAEQSMAAASEEQLNGYLTIIEKYDKIKRIEKMYIHKLQVKEITNFSTYTCSVYNNGIFRT